MASFAWQKVQSRSFGVVDAPVAHVWLEAANGRKRQVLLHVDSGAVVTLVARSVGELLELVPSRGRRIELSAVGGAVNEAHVHELTLRIGDQPEPALKVPVAIATKENVPNLLGRLGVFSSNQVHFDPTMSETAFLGRWLEDGHERIYRFIMEASERIVERWKAAGQNQALTQAVATLMNRAGQLMVGIAAMVQLHRGAGSVASIRSLFEFSLHLEYLLQEPDARAHKFLDYAKLSRWRQLQKWSTDDGGRISREIQQRFPQSDRERIEQSADAVKSQFEHQLRRGGARVFENWTGKRISELADHLGRRSEYDRWYSAWSAWVHGDPFSAPRIRSTHALIHAYRYYSRMLLAMGERMVLTSEEVEGLRAAAREFT